MKITTLQLHCIFGLTTILFITFVSIYQVVVTPASTTLPLSNFFHKEVYRNLFKKAHTVESHKIFILKDHTITATGGNTVYLLPDVYANLEVTWHDKQPFIQYTTKGKVVVFDIAAQKELTEDQKLHLDDHSPAYTTKIICEPVCSFAVIDSKTNTSIFTIPAFTEPSYKPSLRTVKLLFSDVEHQLLGYQTPENEIYVVSFKIELLQNIRLENVRNTAHFLGYIPASKQLVFELVERSNVYKQIALYSADTPSLQLLEKVSVDTQVTPLPQSNALLVGTKIVDLQGKMIQQINDQQIIPGQ